MTDFNDLTPAPVPTGRSIIRFKPEIDIAAIANTIERQTGERAVVFGGDDIATGNSVAFLPNLRTGVTELDGHALNALAAADAVDEVRPEFFLFADCHEQRMRELARELLHDLIERSLTGSGAVPFLGAPATEAVTPYPDTAELTWGLQAIGLTPCSPTGRGVKVCVLDTGIDLTHPDFIDREMTCKSFVVGGHVQDGNGHGTHVAGIIAGPLKSCTGRRYGVAPDVNLCIGKVLADNGSGREFDVLAGVEWAISQGCDIINMSLGRAVRRGEQPDPLYEHVGRVALDNMCIIIAAAGNESSRVYGYAAPVGSPANASTIMAVAAVDPALKVAEFSCGGVNPGGGEVDISAPGVGIFSAYPEPRLSNVLRGTSMACPYVSGVAAARMSGDSMIAGAGGTVLWKVLTDTAKPLGAARDYGAGLVQAPKGSW